MAGTQSAAVGRDNVKANRQPQTRAAAGTIARPHVEKFKQLSTPFYYYDVKLLQDTLDVVKTESGKYGYHVHYAVKANANPRILSIIAANGLGADCVSGGEVQAALDAGFLQS